MPRICNSNGSPVVGGQQNVDRSPKGILEANVIQERKAVQIQTDDPFVAPEMSVPKSTVSPLPMDAPKGWSLNY